MPCPVVFPEVPRGPKVGPSEKSVARVQREKYLFFRKKEIDLGDIDLNNFQVTKVNADAGKSIYRVLNDLTECNKLRV